MRLSSIIKTLAAASAVVLSAKALTACSDGGKAAREAAINNIMTRTSIRAYTPQAVEADKVETMLRCAMASPTARNTQPWHFVAITSRATLDTVASQFPTMKMAAQAPLAIVVCGDMAKTLDGEGRDYWIDDCSAATENLLLAAHALGLGAVWCGVYPKTDRVEAMQALLSLPATIVPLSFVCVGYPAEQPQPKDKWKPENVRFVK